LKLCDFTTDSFEHSGHAVLKSLSPVSEITFSAACTSQTPN